MSESKAVAPVKSIDRDIQQYINWLESIPSIIRTSIGKNPKSAVDTLRKIELLEVSARKAKISEVMSKAARIRIETIREIGKYIIKHKTLGKKSGDDEFVIKDIGLTKNESSLWQKVGALEAYHWEYVIGASTSLSYCAKEYDRYDRIKTMLESNKVKDVGGKLKQYILDGFSPWVAECKLKEVDEDKDLKKDMSEFTGKENKEDSIDSDKPVSAEKRLSEDLHILSNNTEDIIKYYDDVAAFLKRTKSLSKEQYATILSCVKKLNDRFEKVKEGTKVLKERIK
jgi:hypothetical protein